jgi:hypothetical protein
VRVGIAEAAVLGLAGPVLPEDPDEGGEVREVRRRDQRGGGQVLPPARALESRSKVQ